jgi:hypothetical protein
MPRRDIPPEAVAGAVAFTKRLLRDHYGVQGVIEIVVEDDKPDDEQQAETGHS